ncbi:invasion protein IalB [Parvibaculum indicum]|uniref:invasion associated locus B family protein n=1 Tax=Parvibaculum indicum TaxID=562969 RepID=UPI0014227A87|nr:invasion associated locus B family protein [Parvibaculum indicum]NIJ39777.1 invasion protein IalB [Parvibaculum indicum]
MKFRRSFSLALAGLLAAPLLAAPAFAQDKQQQPKPEIKNFGSWSTRCDAGKRTAETCHAFVDVRIGEDKKQRILYMGVGYNPSEKGQLFMFSMTPLGSVLPGGVKYELDGKEMAKSGYAYCLPTGCQAEHKLSAENVQGLKAGNELKVSFVVLGKGPVTVPVKLDGFTAATNDLPKPE